MYIHSTSLQSLGTNGGHYFCLSLKDIAVKDCIFTQNNSGVIMSVLKLTMNDKYY